MQLQSGFRAGTKLILWTLFILQVLLIAIVLIIQQGFDTRKENLDRIHLKFIGSDKNSKYQLSLKRHNKNTDDENKSLYVSSISNVSSDFQIIQSVENGKQLLCFRNGSVNKNKLTNNYNNYKTTTCECQTEWHGKECGQPEVIWRAYMTSKVPIKRISEPRNFPLKVVYMITGYFFSLDLLEIQIKELGNCVDFYIICHKNSNSNSTIDSLIARLKLIFSNKNNRGNNNKFYIYRNYNSNNNNFCIPKQAYSQFKRKYKGLSADDIFLISRDDEILNNRAIKYFQYFYEDPLGLIRFRLKYNVYGFFWQHPESTRISSALISFRQLDQHFKSDPERLLWNRKKSLVIGDLNHMGGWYCRFCYQADEIIQNLQILMMNNDSDNVPIITKINKNGRIDVSYIYYLIANGLYLDGKLGLIKLHKFSDKYYAPLYVQQNNWKFNNIFGNMYLSNSNDDYY